MAGGVGSRFWPMSVEERPKQFLDVLGIGKTLIQMTYERLADIVPEENFYIVTNDQYVDFVKEQLPFLKDEQILAEPMRKNTAPSNAYIAAKIYALNSEATLIVCPSDQLIIKERKFHKIINTAVKHATQSNRLVTLGIKPHRPDTGYGYIQVYQDGDLIIGQVSKVKHFTEKPNREMAEIFLKSGDYYWNSGIFIWKAKAILMAIQKLQPELYELFCSDFHAYNSPKEKEYINHSFAEAESDSIDFAVMENAKNVDVVLSDFGWSDIGTWGSLFEHLEVDANGNSIQGANTSVFNSKNCLINLSDERVAIIQGLDSQIVVESENRLLILDMKDEQNLKLYLKALEERELNK